MGPAVTEVAFLLDLLQQYQLPVVEVVQLNFVWKLLTMSSQMKSAGKLFKVDKLLQVVEVTLTKLRKQLGIRTMYLKATLNSYWKTQRTMESVAIMVLVNMILKLGSTETLGQSQKAMAHFQALKSQPLLFKPVTSVTSGVNK